MSQEKKQKNNEWMQQLWRPMMGWMYMVICMLDMAIFPVLWSALQAYMHMPITQWNPLTLQGAGLFHIAMGAVLGISAFGRTQEKLAGTAVNPNTTQTINTQNITGNTPGGFGSGQNNTGGFGVPSGFGTPSTSGFSGGGFGSAPAPAASGFGGGFGSAATAPIATTANGKKIVPDDPNAFPLQ